MLKSVNGQTSSKRVMGVLYMIVGLLIVTYKEFKGVLINNPEVVIGIIVTGAGLLGVAVLEHFKKK